MVILVTGANGQVGQAIQHISKHYPAFVFYFSGSDEGDVTDKIKLASLFSKVGPSFCINAAAYTAVDRAESEPEKAALINIEGARNVAEACMEANCTLIHISTDFIFDGTKSEPYTEEDLPNPQSVYGRTKLAGEREIQQILTNYYIIRTSWVYSQFGSNFMRTMLRLASERDSISVVDDQIGTPTNAIDLAEAIVKIIELETLNLEHRAMSHFGIYNFSNEGQCSWYDFAAAIFDTNHIKVDLQPIATMDFPTAARRPAYSVLSKDKVTAAFGLSIPDWSRSLARVSGR
ncbi:MAG TPA: dTDP-4-dehydrorhamnose reductase [Flavobacterium sp.]|jgi:dTDP-4-dehydrorhamnose reductase